MSYVKQINIQSLWGNDTENYVWVLQPDVNILVGINGSGKSSFLNIINCIDSYNDSKSDDSIFRLGTTAEIGVWDSIEGEVWYVAYYDKMPNFRMTTSIATHIMLHNINVVKPHYNIQFINLLDLDIPLKESVEYAGQKVKKVVDIQLYELISKFYSYQSHISIQMVTIYRENGVNKDEKATALYANIALFEKLVNELFSETNKKIVLQKGFYFSKNGKRIEPISLSSGEKHLLILFLTVLLQEQKNAILLLDEPEISLHYSWQQKLIEYLRELNPNCQLIIATHSGSIFIEGWADKVQHIQNLKLQS